MKFKTGDFPKDFIWGTATSAYQIEGAWRSGGKGRSIWDTFSHIPGKINQGDTGDTACDFYNLYRDDIELMSRLGYRALRLSISWSRVFPEGKGEVNRKGIEFYRNLLSELKRNNISPAVTLFHWDLPQALEDQGGWRNRNTAEAFADYAAVCFRELGDLADYWMTLNEPSVVSYLGHLTGEMAPGMRDLGATFRVIHNLNLAHGLAVKKFREINPGSKIGIAVDRTLAEAENPEDSKDIFAKRFADEIYYYIFLDPSLLGDYPSSFYEVIKRQDLGLAVAGEDLEAIYGNLDFVGLNYYTRTIVKYDGESPFYFRGIEGPLEKTEMGWELYPQGLFKALDDIRKRYANIPVFITENGRASNDVPQNNKVNDTDRIEFLQNHLMECRKALARGINLKGYYHWSFMDNFEWVNGYTKRFGLIYVDYKTLKRIPKESAYIYSSIIKSN